MEPNLQINMTAILIAVVANFIFGAIWYMPLFGKAWAKEMKMDANGPKPPASAMIKGMSIMVIGNFLMAYVFAHNISVWNPVTWGQAASAMSAGETAGMAAFFYLAWIFPSAGSWAHCLGKCFLEIIFYQYGLPFPRTAYCRHDYCENDVRLASLPFYPLRGIC